MASIGVIGSGTWGTALSVLLNGNGHTVQIWSAIPQEIAELKETRIHRNLPEVRGIRTFWYWLFPRFL